MTSLERRPDGVWNMFPFTVISHGEYTEGCLSSMPTECLDCAARPCLGDTQPRDPAGGTCRYGVGYMRVDTEHVVVGLAFTDEAQRGKPKAFARRRPESRVKRAAVAAAVERARIVLGPAVRDLAVNKSHALAHFAEDPALVQAVSRAVADQTPIDLGAAHDLAQLAARVKGWIGVLLHEVDPTMPPEIVAERPEHRSLGAAYFAASLMCERLDSLKFIENPGLASEEVVKTRVYPLVQKYVRIYNAEAQAKNVQLGMSGQSRGWLMMNPQAGGALVQGILDNLVKYAPSGSSASVSFDESSDQLQVKFASLGPKIERIEQSTIFMRGVRGAAAAKRVGEGQGIGLATCKAVSDQLGIQISVEQSPYADRKHADMFSTCFKLTVPVQV